MGTIFATQNWTIELPKGWEGHGEDSVIALVSSANPLGALQISTFKNEDQRITSKSLFEFAKEDQSVGTTVHLHRIADIPAAELIYYRGDRFWRQIWLGENRLLLHITYNCKKDDEGAEEGQVNSILSTLRLREPVPPPNGG